MDDVDLGRGTVGGYLISWEADGRAAATIAVRVLNGEKPQNIPIVKNNNVYMFDWRAMRRWGLNEEDLPPGSTILFRNYRYGSAQSGIGSVRCLSFSASPLLRSTCNSAGNN